MSILPPNDQGGSAAPGRVVDGVKESFFVLVTFFFLKKLILNFKF
jgi:hypothetical protein